MTGRVATPLAEKLVARIRAAGPMTVAEYMAACLADPKHGYYLAKDPFGRSGDFVTAPEVSQIFGELIGLWAVATWQAMGSPSPFQLVELGPGRGTLIADALRAARIRPPFVEAARPHLVETSGRLREAQKTTLANVGVTPSWHDRIEDVPTGPMILIANEFFDALPVHQFVWSGEGWAERMVGVDDSGRLSLGLRPAPVSSAPAVPPPSSSGEARGRDRRIALHRQSAGRAIPRSSRGMTEGGHDAGDTNPPVGVVREVSPAATAIMTTIAERVARDGGAALVIDYGYAGPALGDTLQAVREHRYDDPLATPGEADLTAHVDFGALARAATEPGALPRPLLSQGEFLARLGVQARSTMLSLGKDASVRRDIEAAVARLTSPSAMGELFKVLAIAPPGLALPAFDEDA